MMLALSAGASGRQPSAWQLAPVEREILAFGPVTLDVVDRRLTVGCGISQILSPQECTMLGALMRRPGVVIRASAVSTELWPDPDSDPLDLDRALRILAFRIRAKLSAMNVEAFLMGSPVRGYRVEGLRRHVRLLSADEVPAVDALIARLRTSAAA